MSAGGYYHFPDYVFDLDCVIQALGVRSFKLIGHSMGGTISLLYSGAFPERVKKLVLIEGVGPVGMNFADAPLRMEKWIGEIRQARPQSLSRIFQRRSGSKSITPDQPETARSICKISGPSRNETKCSW